MTNYTTLSDSELTEALNFHRRQRNMSRGINEAAHARQTQMVRMLEAEEARRLNEEKPNKYVIYKHKDKYGVSQDIGTGYNWDHSYHHGYHDTVDAAKAWAAKHAGKYPHNVTVKEEVELDEQIKGWKHAASDISKMRAAQGKNVKLVSLKKDGTESKMNDATKMFRSEDEAQEHHDRVTKLNPKSKIRHNLYVDGKHVKTLGEEVELDEEFGDYSSKKTSEKKSTSAHPDGKPIHHILHKGEVVGTIEPYSAYREKRKPGSRIVSSRTNVTKYSVHFHADKGPTKSADMPLYHKLGHANVQSALKSAADVHSDWLKKSALKEEVELDETSLNDLVWSKNVTKPGSSKQVIKKYNPGDKVKYAGGTSVVVKHDDKGFVTLSNPNWSKNRVVPHTSIKEDKLAKQLAAKTKMKEEADQIDEISKDTLHSYLKKASKNVDSLSNQRDKVQKDMSKTYSAIAKRSGTENAAHNAITQSQHNKATAAYRSAAKTANKALEGHGDLVKRHTDLTKKINKRMDGMDRAYDKMHTEEVEHIDEISKSTLGSYATKALHRGDIAARMSRSDSDEMGKIANKRTTGVKKAVDRLAGKKTAASIKSNIDKAREAARNRGTDRDDEGKAYYAAQKGISKIREEAVLDEGYNDPEYIRRAIPALRNAVDFHKELSHEHDKKSTSGSPEYVRAHSAAAKAHREAAERHKIAHAQLSHGSKDVEYYVKPARELGAYAEKLSAKANALKEEAEINEASDLRITKIYNKWPKKATYAVHNANRSYFKEFDSEEAARAHHKEKTTMKEEVFTEAKLERNKNTVGAHHLDRDSGDHKMYSAYTGSLVRRLHTITDKDDNILGQGTSAASAMAKAKLKKPHRDALMHDDNQIVKVHDTRSTQNVGTQVTTPGKGKWFKDHDEAIAYAKSLPGKIRHADPKTGHVD